MNSRDKILNSISTALKTGSELRSIEEGLDEKISSSLRAAFPQDNESLWSRFKDELLKIAGEYYSFPAFDEVCSFILQLLEKENINAVAVDLSDAALDAAEKLIEKDIAVVKPDGLNGNERKRITAGIHHSITESVCAVADIGSLAFTMDHSGTSYPHFLCQTTIVLVRKENIAPDQFGLMDKLDTEQMKNMFFITGPSRTADIEKVLVLGAHGPGRLIVISFGK